MHDEGGSTAVTTTPEYLERKLALLDRIHENIVLCVDEKLVAPIDPSRLADSRIMTFRKRIDAGKLLERCNRLA